MNSDFDIISHNFGTDIDNLRIYPLGDLHIGSSEFNMDMWKKWLAMVKNDDAGYVVLIGDILDNGLKNSKTDSYLATLQPQEQKKYLANELGDIKHKIIGVCPGNHESRSSILTGNCPLYDTLCKLDLEDIYRQNMAFINIRFGNYNGTNNECNYNIVLGHGAGRNKAKNFSYSIDGMDIFITGHTHEPESNFRKKLSFNNKYGKIIEKEYAHIVVPSFQNYGGYAIKAMYQPLGSSKIPVIELNGKTKGVTISWI